MERIKVEIQKLGRVTDSVIEIAPFMIFSGESGMGKSYLALLAHYFYEILILPDRDPRLQNLFEFLKYDYKEMAKGFHDEGVALTITKKEIEDWMGKDAVYYLRFMLNNETLEGKIRVALPASVPDRIVLKYREEITGLVNNEDVDIILSIGDIGYRASHSAINDTTPYAILLAAYLRLCLFGSIQALLGTFNLPPSRGPVLSENVLANSGMYKDFIADVVDLSNVQPNPNTKAEPLLASLRSIIEGEVKKENNRYVYLTNGISMPISAAAASVREIAPLQILASRWDISRTAILIEEPEAHLHPEKQRMMADVVGYLRKVGAHVHLTTHSDYFLQRINELIMFQRFVNSHQSSEIAQLQAETGINPGFSINEEDLVAYLLLRQPDGASRVVLQDVKNGVPFSSFNHAVREGMRVRDILETALDR
ncbi:Predicted ATPase [Bacteroidales bacterium WCE2004]|nr:Predicted ATPase [Bacteroidales bacterium WCE2004]